MTPDTTNLPRLIEIDRMLVRVRGTTRGGQMKTFANQLATAIKESGKSQSAIARAAGMCRQDLNRLLQGGIRPVDTAMAKVDRLAEAIGCRREDLLPE
jgi:DNA-binding phage protein